MAPVIDYPHGYLVDETRLERGRVIFCNSTESEEKKRYGKAENDKGGDWVFFHLNNGRQLGRNGRGELIVINTRVTSYPETDDRIVYYLRTGEKGPQASFWALESDLVTIAKSNNGRQPAQPPVDSEPEQVLYRVVLKTYKREHGARNLVHEYVLWEGTDVSTIPLDVWDPRRENSLTAGDTEFVKVWQCKGEWVDCSGPYGKE